MATAAAISLEEYLQQSYKPDMEFIDGQLMEKSMGQLDHEEVIYALRRFLEGKLTGNGYWVTQNTRMQVSRNRVRLPDLAVMPPGTQRTQILRKPPVLVIEVVSPSDRLLDFEDRVADYLAIGSQVWIIDPARRCGYHPDAPCIQDWKIELRFALGEPANIALELPAFFETIPWSEEGDATAI